MPYKKREITVVPYDDNWKLLFEEMSREIKEIFGENISDVQHFGSTSVFGMWAKPIIDILVIAKDISEIDRHYSEMIALGYIPKGEHGIAGRRYFQKFASDGVNHTAHIHCYEQDNQHVADELMFRDYLRINDNAFQKYLNIKLHASEKFTNSPADYSRYKSQFINEILIEAKAFYGCD